MLFARTMPPVHSSRSSSDNRVILYRASNRSCIGRRDQGSDLGAPCIHDSYLAVALVCDEEITVGVHLDIFGSRNLRGRRRSSISADPAVAAVLLPGYLPTIVEMTPAVLIIRTTLLLLSAM